MRTLRRLPTLPRDAALHLRTERLQLVPINRIHAPVMFDILSGASLYEFTGGKPPSDIATLEQLYIRWESRVAPDGSELWLNWVLHETQRDEIIGHVQAGVGPDYADVAWVIGSRWQGQGYASEAARSLVDWLAALGIGEIRASIRPDHAASIRVAERAGLRRSDEVRDDGEVVWRRSVAMADPAPVWKVPTRAQAKEVLVSSRARMLALIDQLEDMQMKSPTHLGGGAWSVKDLLGHLSGYEEQAVAIVTGKKPRFDFAKFASVDERNAADIERKRNWTVKRVRDDLETTRSRLLEAIDGMDEERWTAKVQTRTGRSALALVLGRLLVGGHHGLFAHDLAHIRDLEKSVKRLKGSLGEPESTCRGPTS